MWLTGKGCFQMLLGLRFLNCDVLCYRYLKFFALMLTYIEILAYYFFHFLLNTFDNERMSN